MLLQLQSLNLSDAILYGNVELKSAIGTLPERLTIEKLFLLTYVDAGLATLTFPYLSPIDGKLYLTRGLYGTATELKRYDPDTMNLEQEKSDTSLRNYVIIGDDTDYLYLWLYSGKILKKVLKSNFTTVLTSGDIVGDQYCRPCFCGDYIYCGSAWGAGCGINKINKNFSIIETFGTDKINVYMSMLFTEDEENFFWKYQILQKYVKSTNTNYNLLKTEGYDLSDVDQGYGAYGSVKGNMFLWDNDNFIHYDGNYFLIFNKNTKENIMMFAPPVKIGAKTVWPSSAMYFNFTFNDTYLFINLGTGGYCYKSYLLRISWADNIFENSYAEWDVSDIENIKKIIIVGGFSKGYGDSYADAKQIEVKYYNGTIWVEYDIDTLPDITESVQKIRVGFKDKYLGNDRLPYVSQINVLYEQEETTPDVGIRSFDVLDISQQLEVIEL